MFQPGSECQGTSQDNPIVITDVSAYEFECLLEFMYDGYILQPATNICTY